MIEAIFQGLQTIWAVAFIVIIVLVFAVIPACLWPDDPKFFMIGEIVTIIALCNLIGMNTGGILAALLYVLVVALPINILLSDLFNHLTPSSPHSEEKMQQARAKIRQALADIRRHETEDDGYWGDSDLHWLDMALTEAEEAAPASTLRLYLPGVVQLIASVCLATSLFAAVIEGAVWWAGGEAHLTWWIILPLAVGLLLLIVPFTIWYVSRPRNEEEEK